MNTSTSVDEALRIKKMEREEALINVLNEAPVIYEWYVNAPPFNAFIVYCISVTALSIAVGAWLSISKSSWFPFIICTTFGIIMGSYLRYLCMPNKIYYYQLTPIGIRYTIQDAIPEVAYKIVRIFAWIGVAVCIFAVGVLGPMAFVGAGGMALLAFGMTNFSSQIREKYTYFVDTYEVNILRKRDVFSLDSIPLEYHVFGTIYCEKGKLDETLNRILPYLNNYTIKEIKSYRDL